MAPRRDETAGAEHLCAQALAYLASDEERMWRFFDLTGLSPDTIREVAGTPGFALAVLDHLLGDEQLLLAFAADSSVDPAAVMKTRSRLAGPHAEGLREG
jgi:hypothetical protein